MAIVTLADAKSHLRIGSTTTHDAYITGLITSCEDWIAAYCGVTFAQSNVADELIDGGTLILTPTVLPVISVSSIEDTENDDELIDPTLYSVRRRGPRLKSFERWKYGLDRWKINYIGGYDTPPSGISNCVLQMVYRAFNNKGGQEAEQSSDVWVKWLDFSSSENINLMNLYRIGPMI